MYGVDMPQINRSPGEVIQSYILDGLGISVRSLAQSLDVPTNRLYLIIQNKRDITVDTAIRLGKFLDMDPLFWLNLQSQYHIQAFLKTHPNGHAGVKPHKKPI